MIEAVRKELWVPASPEAAFERFTAGMDLWWPRGTHSVSQGRCAEVRFEGPAGGRIYEVDDEGTEHDWGTMRAWDPPARLVFSWHPGRDPGAATEVEVTFAAEGDGTRLRLEHRGWEALGAEAAGTRDGYHRGWDPVLAELVASLEVGV